MITFDPDHTLETLGGLLAIVTKGQLTPAAKDAFSHLRKLERTNMQEYGYELNEDPVSGVKWFNEVRRLAMMSDPGAGWLWDHPVGDPFENADLRALNRLRLFFKRPLGGIEEDEWIAASMVERGGSGSGNFGHAGRPGERGGSASASGGAVGEAVSFVKRLTLTGGDIGDVELSGGARAFLAQTVTKDSTKLYRGIALVKGRISEERMRDVRGMTSGSEAPDYLAKTGNPYSSYTTKKSVARYYSEGKVSVVIEATVPKKNIVVNTRNLQKVMRAAGQEDLFSADDYDYFKSEAEVIVQEPISATILSIKSMIERGGAGSGNFGHAGRPGKRGGSASGGGLGKKIGSGEDFDLYKVSRGGGGSLPANPEFGLMLVLGAGKGDVYYAKYTSDVEDRWDASTHGEVANVAGLTNKEYDSAVRLAITREGMITSRVSTAGLTDTDVPRQYWANEEMFSAIDSQAFSNIRNAASKLRYLGVSGDTPFAVRAMSGYRDEGVLSEWKALLQITKGGSGSGNYGHRGRPGKRGGSSSRGGRSSRPQQTGSKQPNRTEPKVTRGRRPGTGMSDPVRTPFGGWHDITVQAAFKHRFDQTINAIMTTNVEGLPQWQKRNLEAMQAGVKAHRKDNPFGRMF